MMKASAAILPCGKRLHLQHGPIDLIIGVDQNAEIAFEAANQRFETVLVELVAELPALRSQLSLQTKMPNGAIASKMHLAALPHCKDHFVTRMAAIAGAVADTVLEAMKSATVFNRAYVNNGGDIALYLGAGQSYTMAMASHDGRDLGRISIADIDDIAGIATSGRSGRSFSLGIADSVTVIAETAAGADVAATLIANAVDIPNHPLVTRRVASLLDPDSDLGERRVVMGCEPFSLEDQHRAIAKGEVKAKEFFDKGLIKGAAIFFQNENRIVGSHNLTLSERKLRYA